MLWSAACPSQSIGLVLGCALFWCWVSLCVPFTHSLLECSFIMMVATIIGIFMAILFILNYTLRLSVTSPVALVLLHWRENERVGVSDHQPHDCLLSCLFRRRSKKTSKLRVAGLCAGNSPLAGEFPAQMASNAENVPISWRHHATTHLLPPLDILFEYIGLNMLSSDSFMSCLDSLLWYSAGEFRALQLIILVVFGAVD